MAQQTSEVWKRLIKEPGTSREYKFEINGKTYGKEEEISHSVDSGLYEDFGIGNANYAILNLEVLADDIPRGSVIKRYVRLVNGAEESEWLPQGVFFTNKRGEEDGVWTVEAFDVLCKANQVWEPRQDIEFPMPMPDAVNEFAKIMGCEIDERTVLNPAYTIDYPANEYTLRDELRFIAAAHGGNWIVTAVGKLLLVPLLSMPDETFYLIDENGDTITLGGVRILVG